MSRRNSNDWSRLDNAAKIFPSVWDKRDTKVFRFSCELKEPVDPEQLLAALNKTLELFPHFRTVLRRGLFWYYLDASTLPIQVHRENQPPCAPLYDREKKSLLFRVSYYKCRINFEIYHALTDGTGALQFLRMLVYHYLIAVHAEDFPEGAPAIDYDASLGQTTDDSFTRYYRASRTKGKKRARLPRAYHMKGPRLPEYRMRVLEGEMSAKAVLEQARARNTTITSLLAGALMYAAGMEMTTRERKRPIILGVPVNLRNYFASESARNFFAVIHVPYLFSDPNTTLEDVIQKVDAVFKQELTQENLACRLNSFGALEHNAAIRVIPLLLKDLFLAFGEWVARQSVSGMLSNIGRISMPEELVPYIHGFDIFNSTSRIQMCVCSFGDRLMVSCTSPFVHTELYKNLFRILTDMGIEILIHSNQEE